MTENLTCQLTATLQLLPTSQVGRSSGIMKNVYKPLFCLGAHSATCRIDEIDQKSIMPGEKRIVKMTLAYPSRLGNDLQIGNRFEIHEGKKLVGWGFIEKMDPTLERRSPLSATTGQS